MTPAPLELLLHTYSFRFRLLHDPGFDVVALLDRAVADGFAGIGLNVNGPRYRFLGGDEPGHVARVADAIAARGLEVDVETSGTAPAHLATLLDLAGRLGARYLRTYIRHRGPRPDVLAATVADLRAAAPLARRAGVPILLENHEELTGREVDRVLAAVDSEWVGALYDYGNSMMVREDPLEALEAMLPWVRKAHLKDHVVLAARDAPRGVAVVAGVPLGRGNLDLRETTRRLLAAGVGRIAFENVWSYTAPFRPREDGRAEEPLGAGVFRPVPLPRDPAIFLADVDAVLARDPGRVIALEEEAYVTARRGLRVALDGAGSGAEPPESRA